MVDDTDDTEMLYRSLMSVICDFKLSDGTKPFGDSSDHVIRGNIRYLIRLVAKLICGNFYSVSYWNEIKQFAKVPEKIWRKKDV